MKTPAFALLTAAVVSSSAFASKSVTPPPAFATPDPACHSPARDAYEPASRILLGKFAGQCLENGTKRALLITQSSPEAFEVLNLRSGGKFYKTTLAVDNIESVYFQWVDLRNAVLNRLGASVAHNHVRLKLKRPIVLSSQTGDGTEMKEVRELIASFNFMGPASVSYNPVKGFRTDYYGGVLQIYDLADEVENRFEARKLNVYQMEMTLSEATKAALFRQLIQRSHDFQYGQSYNTWTASCTTKIFDVIDEAIGYSKVDPARLKILDPFRDLTTPMRRELLERGLVTPTTPIELVNKEFGFPAF